MKPLFILLTALSSLFTSNSFAKDKNVNEAAVRSFNSTFINAAEVKWSATNSFYKADFSLSGQYASAFFNLDGELIAVTRNVSSLQLPITLQAKLKKDYADFWVTELFEVSTDGATDYYITLETADEKLVLKAAPGSSWSKHKKSRKI